MSQSAEASQPPLPPGPRARWLRRSLFLLGVGAGLGAGALYYAQTPHLYRSTACIILDPRQPDSSRDNVCERIEGALSTQALLLHSRAIAELAILRHELQTLPSLTGESDPVGVVADSVSVDAGPQPSIPGRPLLLTFRGPVAGDCPIVLEALLAGYSEYLTEKYRDEAREVEQLLERVARSLKQDLERLETAQRAAREHLGEVGKAHAGFLPGPSRLATLEAHRQAAHARQAEIRRALDRLDHAGKDATDPNLLTALGVPGVRPRREPTRIVPTANLDLEQVVLAPLLIEQETLLQDFGPEHPSVQALKEKIERVRRYFADLPHPAPGLGDPEPGQNTAELLTLYVRSLKQDLLDQELAEEAFAALLDRDRTTATVMTDYQEKDETLRGQIARTRELHDALRRQCESLATTHAARGFSLRVLAAPSRGEPEGPSAPWVLAAAGCLGAALGGSLSLLVRFWK